MSENELTPQEAKALLNRVKDAYVPGADYRAMLTAIPKLERIARGSK